MKMNLRLLSAATLITLTTFTACKKETSTPAPVDNGTELTAQSEDQANVSSEVDDVTSESSLAMESNASFTGRSSNTMSELCDGATVIDSSVNPRTITITYNGAARCNGKPSTRSGSVVISMANNMRWKDVGAVITVAYKNLKITKTGTNKSITINGTHTITNVSGGLLKDFPNRQTLEHTITSSDMSITFEDGTQRTWQVARKRVYTLTGTGLIVTITGTKTEGSVTGIAEWGSNRNGHNFVTAITQPLVLKQDCMFRLTAGQISHVGIANITVTYGLNADGIATTCPATGASYYFKATWTGLNGETKTIIRPY